MPRAQSPERIALAAAASETIRLGSRSFHAASQLFDRTTRERAWLLYTWCRHCDDVADGQVLGHAGGEGGDVAEVEALTRRVLAGEAVEGLPYEALAAVLAEVAIPHQFLLDHIEGFALDAADWRPQGEADLVRYCYHVAGAVGCMMAVVMGVDPEDRETLSGASALGIAFQLSNIARDIADDAAAGRCYVPAEWLAEAGLREDTLLDDPNRDALVGMVKRMTDLSAAYEAEARAQVHALPFRARWAVLAAARIYGKIGRKVAALGPDAWDARVVVRRRRKLAYLFVSLWETLRARKGGTDKGTHGAFRDHRPAAEGALPAALLPRG